MDINERMSTIWLLNLIDEHKNFSRDLGLTDASKMCADSIQPDRSKSESYVWPDSKDFRKKNS